MEKLKCLQSGIEGFVTLLKGGLVARSLIFESNHNQRAESSGVCF
ncbi:hypothetical protein SAMN03159376_04292 [Pseudomonas sp. NFACC09-4]|nr:hypothetical protein SAMN03159376_04292 [Pseudomonas sp. NFACC09-4]